MYPMMKPVLTILINWAPLLIIAGVWIVVMRQMRGRLTKVRGGPPASIMTISLPNELVEFIQREIRAGEYLSADEIIRAGLRELRREKMSAESESRPTQRENAAGIEQPPAEYTS
jgi:putative addiction module CopG family antidote